MIVNKNLAANYLTSNPIIPQGEFALETDTNKIKLGDGLTSWSSLSYTASYSNPTLTGTIVLGSSSSNSISMIGKTTGTIYTNDTSSSVPTLKMHNHLTTSGVANEFKGEFINTSGTMDGIASHWHLSANSTGVMRSMIGVSYLDPGITLSGTSAAGSWISGGLFSTILDSTSILNGTAVVAYGSYSEVTSAIDSTLTTVAHTAAICGYSKLLTKPTTGECSILHLAQAAGATTVNQAIYLTGTATTDTLITFDVAAAGKAIETNTAVPDGATSYCIHIKIGNVDGYIPVFAAKTF
jgi:hypothetical protein